MCLVFAQSTQRQKLLNGCGITLIDCGSVDNSEVGENPLAKPTSSNVIIRTPVPKVIIRLYDIPFACQQLAPGTKLHPAVLHRL